MREKFKDLRLLGLSAYRHAAEQRGTCSLKPNSSLISFQQYKMYNEWGGMGGDEKQVFS